MCRNEKFPVVVNKQSDREIKSLHVVCTNRENGCEWQGELNCISNHLEGCLFQEVKCSNKCGKILQQRYLTSHLGTECPRRKVGCFYCHAKGEYQFIMGEHATQCPKLPLPCPNNCEVGNIPRKDIKNHLKVCKLQDVICSKCKKVLQRQYLIGHVKTICPYRIVDCLYCHISGEHQFIRSWQHRKVCPKLPLPCPNKCNIGSVPRENMEAHRKECPLEIVQCEYHNVGCEERFMRKNTEEHERMKMKQHLMLTKENAAQSRKQLRQIKGKMELLQRGVIEATDEIVECITTQPSIPTIPVIVRMPEFSNLKKCSEVWISPSFASHLGNQPVTMKMHVYADGNDSGRGSHLSLYLHVTEGPKSFEVMCNDKFDITLLDQIDSQHSHAVTVSSGVLFHSEWSIGLRPHYSKCPEYLAHSYLQANSSFLKDDCLYFKISHHDRLQSDGMQ